MITGAVTGLTPRREAGAHRAGRGDAVRAVLRRPGDGRGLGGAHAAHPRAGRARHRLQERRRGDLPAQPRPRPAGRRQLHRRPGGAHPGADLHLRRRRLRRASRRSPSWRTWPGTRSSTTTRGCRRPTCGGCWSRRPAGSCPRSTSTWARGRSSSSPRADMDVRLNTRLESVSDEGMVRLSDGEEFPSETLVWTAGHEAQPDARRDRPAARRPRPGGVRGRRCRCAGCPTPGRPVTSPPSPTSPRTSPAPRPRPTRSTPSARPSSWPTTSSPSWRVRSRRPTGTSTSARSPASGCTRAWPRSTA